VTTLRARERKIPGTGSGLRRTGRLQVGRLRGWYSVPSWRSSLVRRVLAAVLLGVSCALTACTAGGGGGGAGAVQSNVGVDWRDEVIYQALTDRFANGDVNNDWNVDRTALARYQGGDYQGLIEKAGYLQALGVTAVWISPIIKNVEQDAGVSGYHGYWAQDFLSLNPHFGDLGALRRMVQALHARGIKVILDIVTNHIGQLFFYDINLNGTPDDNLYGSGSTSPLNRITEYDPDWQAGGVQARVGAQSMGLAPVVWINNPWVNRVAPQPAVFQNPDWYHRNGRVVPLANGSWPADQTLLGDFPGGLKDLATERQDVRDALVQVYGTWIERVDFDGFRIDTIKHVEESFWTDFCSRIRQIARAKGKENFLIFGEAFDGSDDVCARYTKRNMLDSVFYFPQKFVAFDGVIGSNQPTKNIEDLWNRKSKYGQTAQPGGIGLAPSQAFVNFIDNHDVRRFLSNQPDEKRLRLALGFLMAEEGIPCLYYGTEQGFRGAADPANRERLWDSGYDMQGALFQFTRDLIALRKAHPALRRGETRVRWSTANTGSETDAGIFAFERVTAQETVLYVLNVNPQQTSRTSFGAGSMQTSFPQGTALRDLLDATYQGTVGAGGKLDVAVGPLSQRFLVAR